MHQLPFRFRFLLVVFVSITSVFFSCEEEADLFRRFHLREGEHYATPRVMETLKSSKLVFLAKFDSSCRYHFENTGFQDSKNKLLGFSDCNSMHHENSARFVWQWYNNRMEIFAYCYVNGERKEQFVGVVDLEETNQYEISMTDNAYVFRLNNGDPVTIERQATCRTGVYYMLWPYFGGSLPAPHNMHLEIKIIY